MPRADSVFFMLAGVLGLWGLSLIVRGIWGDRARGRRRCPACQKHVPDGVMRCEACGYESPRGLDFRAPVRRWGMIIGGAVVAPLAWPCFVAGQVVRRLAYTGGEVESLLASGPVGMLALGIGSFGAVTLMRALYGRGTKGVRRCPRCWYDMTGAQSLVCPECGHDAAQIRNLYRRRRRPRTAWAGALVILFALCLLLIPAVNRKGWVTLVPDFVLIAGLENFPDRVLGTGRFWSAEDNLVQRFRNESLSRRGKARLLAKCHRILSETNDPVLLARALSFTMYDQQYTQILLRRALRGITDPAPEVRAATATLFSNWFFWWTAPDPAIVDEITASKSRLLEVAALDPGTPGDMAVGLLHWVKDDPQTLADTLLGFVDQRNSERRVNLAVMGLYILAVNQPTVRPHLLPTLQSPDRAHRIAAYLALGGTNHPYGGGLFVGPATPGPTPEDDIARVHQIRELLLNPGTWTLDNKPPPKPEAAVVAASRAFRREAVDNSLPGLIAGLDSLDAKTRQLAAELLQWLARDSDADLSPALARLRALSSTDPEPLMQDAATKAVNAIEKPDAAR